MRLHRLGADAELCGNLFVRHALYGPEDDLVLSIAQDTPQLRRGFFQLIHPLAQVFHDPGQELALDPDSLQHRWRE